MSMYDWSGAELYDRRAWRECVKCHTVKDTQMGTVWWHFQGDGAGSVRWSAQLSSVRRTVDSSVAGQTWLSHRKKTHTRSLKKKKMTCKDPRRWAVPAETTDSSQTESLRHFCLFLWILFLGAIFALTVCLMIILLGCAFSRANADLRYIQSENALDFTTSITVWLHEDSLCQSADSSF